MLPQVGGYLPFSWLNNISLCISAKLIRKGYLHLPGMGWGVKGDTETAEPGSLYICSQFPAEAALCDLRALSPHDKLLPGNMLMGKSDG